MVVAIGRFCQPKNDRSYIMSYRLPPKQWVPFPIWKIWMARLESHRERLLLNRVFNTPNPNESFPIESCHGSLTFSKLWLLSTILLLYIGAAILSIFQVLWIQSASGSALNPDFNIFWGATNEPLFSEKEFSNYTATPHIKVVGCFSLFRTSFHAEKNLKGTNKEETRH